MKRLILGVTQKYDFAFPLNYIIIDQGKLLTIFQQCYVKFEQTNQISPPLKITKSINVE